MGYFCFDRSLRPQSLIMYRNPHLKKPTLESLRDEIDKIDTQVVDLLNRGCNLRLRLAKSKQIWGRPTIQLVKSKYLAKFQV